MSLNGTNVAPDVSGNVALTNMMQKNVAQTMSAQLIAQNNTNYTTKQVRNILLVAKSASSSLPTGANGDICIIYKD